MYYYHWIVTMMLFSLFIDLVVYRSKGYFTKADVFWAVWPQCWFVVAIILKARGY